MACSRKVIARSIDIHILQQVAETRCRSHLLLHLPSELLYLERLLLELTVNQEKVCEALGEEVIPVLNLIRESLAMVTVELQRADDGLLGNIK